LSRCASDRRKLSYSAGDPSTDDDDYFGEVVTQGYNTNDDYADHWGNKAQKQCNAVSNIVEECRSWQGTPLEQLVEGIVQAMAGANGCTLCATEPCQFDETVNQIVQMLENCFGGAENGSQCDGSTLLSGMEDVFSAIADVVETCIAGATDSPLSAVESAVEAVVKIIPVVGTAIDAMDIAVDGVQLYDELHSAYWYYGQNEYGCMGEQIGLALTSLQSIVGDVQDMAEIANVTSVKTSINTSRSTAGVVIVAVCGFHDYVLFEEKTAVRKKSIGVSV
jgi:hypothetical protein